MAATAEITVRTNTAQFEAALRVIAKHAEACADELQRIREGEDQA